MSFWDGLMGGEGNSKWQVKQQMADNEKRRAFIEQQIAQGRSDLQSGYGAGLALRNQGMQQGFDVLGQTIPQQFDTFQQGNMGAQATLLAGLPQYQNAIMGLPVDMSGFSPQAIDYNTDWAQQYAPGYSPLTGAFPEGGQDFSAPGADTTPSTALGDQSQNASLGSGNSWGGDGGLQANYSAQQISRPSNGMGYAGSGYGGSNPFADTYNASDLEKLFGNSDIGSEAQLALSENGGLIGRAVGLLTGIPGLNYLGGWLGDRNIANKTWMNPVDPQNPYASNSDASQALNALFNPDANLPNSPAYNEANIGSINTPYVTNSLYNPNGYSGSSGSMSTGTRLKKWPKSTDQD